MNEREGETAKEQRSEEAGERTRTSSLLTALSEQPVNNVELFLASLGH